MRLPKVLMLLSLFLFAAPAQASIEVGEAGAEANASSTLWELNHDSATGALLLSDSGGSTVWIVNPLTGAFTRADLPSSIEPADARRDSAGNLWFTDFTQSFGRVDAAGTTVTTWDLGASRSPAGIGVDASGFVWMWQFLGDELLRYTPGSATLCAYAVGGSGNYLTLSAGTIWFGDRSTGRLLRLTSATGGLRAWPLPAGATPEALAVAPDGKVWYTDPLAGALGALDPAANTLAVYTLPVGVEPEILALDEEVIWFSDRTGLAGFIDPAVATATNVAAAPTDSTLVPTCSSLAAGVTSPVTQSNGTLSYSTATWSTNASTAGVVLFQMPVNALGWGLVHTQGRAWLADQRRNLLVRFPRAPAVPAPAVALASPGVALQWPPVTLDEGGLPVSVDGYQVWRSSAPYFAPGDASAPVLAGTPIGPGFSDTTANPSVAPIFYRVRAIAASGLQSRASARVGAFAFTLAHP